MNNDGSPTSPIDSSLATIRRQTNTSNSDSGNNNISNNNNNNSNSNNDVCEKTLIGSWVAGVRKSVTHFWTILSSRIVEERTRYEIVYDDTFQEEIDSLELSRRQKLYYKERDNDVVGQQKKKARSTLDDKYVGIRVAFWHTGLAFYCTMKRCFLGSWQAKTWHIVYGNTDSEDVLLVLLKNNKNCMQKKKYMIQ